MHSELWDLLPRKQQGKHYCLSPNQPINWLALQCIKQWVAYCTARWTGPVTAGSTPDSSRGSFLSVSRHYSVVYGHESAAVKKPLGPASSRCPQTSRRRAHLPPAFRWHRTHAKWLSSAWKMKIVKTKHFPDSMKKMLHAEPPSTSKVKIKEFFEYSYRHVCSCSIDWCIELIIQRIDRLFDWLIDLIFSTQCCFYLKNDSMVWKKWKFDQNLKNQLPFWVQ